MHVEQIMENITFPWIEFNFVLQRHAGMYEATVGIPALGKKSDHMLSYLVNGAIFNLGLHRVVVGTRSQ
jgi:hypothetical protein